MAKIPNGIQRHNLWSMDGRTWIESAPASNEESPMFKRALERGWVRPIPQELIEDLVENV